MQTKEINSGKARQEFWSVLDVLLAKSQAKIRKFRHRILNGEIEGRAYYVEDWNDSNDLGIFPK